MPSAASARRAIVWGCISTPGLNLSITILGIDKMNTISFMGANYVARQVDYAMHGWGHGDKAANAYFSPLETFGARFEEILRDIHSMGFSAMDMWTSHLNYLWATDQHIAIAL